jgi:hypothetical protein
MSDDNIRLPDSIIREKLIDNDIMDYNFIMSYNENEYNNNFEIELKQIMEQSKLEYEEKELLDIQIDLVNNLEKRENIFKDFRKIMKRLISFDNELKSIYIMIIPILDLYESNLLDNYYIDENTYIRIFNILEKTRVSKSDIELLKTIIIK